MGSHLAGPTLPYNALCGLRRYRNVAELTAALAERAAALSQRQPEGDGVTGAGEEDEFDGAGLGRHRRTERWQWEASFVQRPAPTSR